MEGLAAVGGRALTARYALEQVLARGGVGEVWRGRDLRLGRPVAVKVLHGAQADPRFRDRFRHEARSAAGLSHPNIAAVFDYGEEVADDGDAPTPFLVMELVEGESLADLLARRGRLGVGRTLSILRQVSSALAAAHEAGVVHRDVKPANVLVRTDGVVKITDFGIAASAASAALTETGHVVGTARYLSPEQARGRRGTPASDVYALGLVGYECLAGRPAFDGPDPVEVAARQVAEPPPPLPPDVPEQVRGLVGTATAKDPAHRIPDGAALRDAVDRLLEGDGRAARAGVPLRRADGAALRATTVPTSRGAGRRAVPPVPPPGGSAPRPPRRRRWWRVTAGGGLLFTMAAALALVGVPGAAGSGGPVRVRTGSGQGAAPVSSAAIPAGDRGEVAVVPAPAAATDPAAASAPATEPAPAGAVVAVVAVPTQTSPRSTAAVRGAGRGSAGHVAAGATVSRSGTTAGTGAPATGSARATGPARLATPTPGSSPGAGATTGSGAAGAAGGGGSAASGPATSGPRGAATGPSGESSGSGTTGTGTTGASGSGTNGTGSTGTGRSGGSDPDTGTAGG